MVVFASDVFVVILYLLLAVVRLCIVAWHLIDILDLLVVLLHPSEVVLHLFVVILHHFVFFLVYL